jgi:hypothetical protein
VKGLFSSAKPPPDKTPLSDDDILGVLSEAPPTTTSGVGPQDELDAKTVSTPAGAIDQPPDLRSEEIGEIEDEGYQLAPAGDVQQPPDSRSKEIEEIEDEGYQLAPAGAIQAPPNSRSEEIQEIEDEGYQLANDSVCPSCHRLLDDETAVVCTQCGLDLRTGKRL